LLPADQRWARWARRITLELGLAVGGVLILAGLAASIYAVLQWRQHAFGPLEPSRILRIIIPAILSFTLGCQVVLGSFFLSVLGLRRRGARTG
jgi:hypothetical protein